MEAVYGLIRSLGISNRYKGFQYLGEAVNLVMEMADCSFMVTKEIYPTLARKYSVKPETIEQNIRTVVGQCWEKNHSRIEQMAGYKMYSRPTNTEMIEILAFYLSHMNRKVSIA